MTEFNYDVLSNTEHMAKVNNVKDAIATAGLLLIKGYRVHRVLSDITPLLSTAQNEYSAHLKGLKEDKQKELKQLIYNFESEKKVYDDPQQEALNRQDFEVKLNAMRDTEVIDFLMNVNAEDITPYEFNRLVATVNDKGLESTGLQEKITELKYAITQPYTASQEYKQLENDITVLDNIPVSNEVLWYHTGTDFKQLDVEQTLNRVIDEYKDVEYRISPSEEENVKAKIISNM
ncbi:hypothetical protein [Macrococcus epidermidis]|uniref:hypothetical protein n=1 Tax=Macrococcus epidermidis TaxID=1902580 RepID=UPI0020B6A65D|nr:hypothetical protein [Macrococcus epidermidis]UTH16175.1 hypothetical protein KFV12_13135 [Macrococcus epidermidis]